MRKSLGNLLALDSASSDWVDEVRRSVSSECGRHYLCTECGNTGAHALTKDVQYGLYYRCLECGGKGMVVHGGVSAMSDVGSDCGRDDCGHVGDRFGCDGGATVLPEEFGCATDGDHGSNLSFDCHIGCSGHGNVGGVYCAGSVHDDEEEDDSEYLPGEDEDLDEEELIESMESSDGGTGAEEVEGSSCSDETIDEDDMNVPVELKFRPHVCDNCHRKSTGTRDRYGRVDGQSVRLGVAWVTAGSFQRRCATMKYAAARLAAAAANSGSCKKNRVRLTLCQQCKRALTNQPPKIMEEDVWPAMMWSWLTDLNLMRRFGSDLWKVVPDEWRHWWIDAIVDCVPVFHGVTLDNPLPIFSDVTGRKRELERGIASMRASDMQRVCNDHLLPLVRCPWGCSEYFHKCGLLSFDLVVRKIFGPSVKPVFGSEKYVRDGESMMEGTIPDYADVRGIPRLLGNEAWKVSPSVAFIDGIPRVLSCRNHGDGSGGKCFYPPRNPHGVLPSCMADQIAPAVVRPRNVKQFKPHAYSDTYQMSEMQGQFAGVDTFHLTTTRDFGSESVLQRQNEALAMKGRKDIASLVTEWGDSNNNVLPPYVSEDMLQNAEDGELSNDVVEDCCRAATYVTLSDAVKIYQANKERQGRVVCSNAKGEAVESHYVPPWPSTAVHVHPFNAWGCEFPLLMGMQHPENDCHLVWSLSAMLVGVPSLWEKTDAIVHDSADWYGWLLAYLTPICFPRAGSGRNNPFKFENRSFSPKRLEELLIKIGMKTPVEEEEEEEVDMLPESYQSNGGCSFGEAAESEVGEGSAVFSGNDQSSVGEIEGEFSDAEEHVEGGDGNVPSDQSEVEEGSAIFSGNDQSSVGEIEGEFSDAEEHVEGGDGNAPNDHSLGSEVGGSVPGVEGDVESVCDGVPDENSIFTIEPLDDEDSCCVLHTDGSFHAEDIRVLMSSYDDVKVVSDTDFCSEDFTVEKGSEIVIVFSCDGRSDFPVENVAGEDDVGLELRFVSGRELNRNDASDFAFMRHGGGALTNWWVQRRQGSTCLQDSVESTDLHGGQRWHFALYVRESSMSVEHCRNLMLNSMGVAQHVRCREHDLPLITAPFRSKESNRTCCSKSVKEKCSGRLICCCPVRECAVALCLKHKGKIYESDDVVYLSSSNGGNDDDAPPSSRDSVISLDEDLGSDVSHVSMNSAQLDWLGPSPWAEHEIFGGRESEESSAGDGVFVTGNIESPLEIKGDPESLPGCVILNNVGSLLVRKRNKGKPSLNFRHFMERIVATTPGESVPLVFPEGMLFPSLFWKDDDTEGSILGAMPCGALAHSDTLSKFGIADLTTQMRSRITNPALGTSTDPRYLCYAFDTIVNLGCRHEDTRVVLHRGIVGTKSGIALREDSNSHFNVDSIDSRPTVNKLAAAVAQKQVTYFFTHTPNDSDHFGLAPIRYWICSEEALIANGGNPYDAVQSEEVSLALRQAACSVFLRNWMETAIIYMNYISNSPEHPLGDVEHIWWRFEFQDAVGNLPHVHALLWLRDGSESFAVTENRIRGSVVDLLSSDEVDALVAEGLLSCRDEAMAVKDLAKTVLTHVCNSRCKRRVGVEDDELRCRVTDNAKESPNCARYSTREINVRHSEEAYKVLQELGLFVEDQSGKGFVPVEEVFKASKHYPPADPSEGNISACNGRLFALTRSNQNLKIMTGYLASRYLAKYVALIDENNRVYIGSMSRERNTVRAEKEVLHNTKITGSAIMEAEREAKKKNRAHPKGRAISHMEMLCVILGYPQVYTDLEFFHVPTVPLEERPAVERIAPIKRLVEEEIVPPEAANARPGDLDAGDIIPSWQVRNEDLKVKLPLWRTWSDLESLSLRDQCFCPLTLDAISIFGVRPPELRWVRQPHLYFRWFYRDDGRERSRGSFQKRLAYLAKELDPEYEECSWVDGTDCRVYVRQAAVSEILEYLLSGGVNGSHRSHASFYAMGVNIPDVGSYRLVEDIDDDGRRSTIHSIAEENPYNEVFGLFSTIRLWQLDPPRHTRVDQVEQWEALQERFFGNKRDDGKTQKLPIVWFNSVKPSEPVRWLIHLLVSMGEFDCEAGLLGCGDMVQNFTRAGLLREGNVYRQEDVELLARRYAKEQLVYLPGGTYQFDKHLVQARGVLQTVLVDETMPCTETPAGLYTHLRLSIDKGCEKHCAQARKHLCDVLWADIADTGMFNMPFGKDDLEKATLLDPIDWTPTLQRTPIQSEASFAEQELVIASAVSTIVQYQNFTTTHPKGIVAAGGPGSGKTSCLQSIGLIARSRGLNVGMAAVMCERAQQLGGIHFARFCKFPAGKMVNPCRLAELAIANLMRSPTELEYIRSLDVLLIDEMGQISAEMLSALDIIFRRVRNNSSFFGGMLVFASMDALQLRPVDGRPPLLSPQMTTCFDFLPLDHSVRAAQCPALQRLVQICRLSRLELTEDIHREFVQLITGSCTFVADWDDPRLRPHMLRMFATHNARREAEARLMAAVRRRYGTQLVEITSTDREASVEGNWVEASSATSSVLTKLVKEPRELYFYPGAIYEITYNRPGHHAQSQLAVLAEVPTLSQARSFEPVRLYVAPEGMKAIPTDLKTEDDFLRAGFKIDTVGQAPSHIKYIGLGFQAKREQYGLRPRIAATIHAGMGQDLPSVITKVDGSEKYKLFQREQVVVLLSRTHFAKDIYFVGKPDDTARCLWEALNERSTYDAYLDYLMKQLTNKATTNEYRNAINLPSFHPCRPIDCGMPQDSSGYVYILASVRKNYIGKVTYIGETTNLVTRYHKHLNGTATEQTADPAMRPWVLLAYISGFEGCSKSGRAYFEALWQSARNQQNAHRETPLTADQVAGLGRMLVDERRYTNSIDLQDKKLRFHLCGVIRDHPVDPKDKP